jgi:hypothetical protein
MVLRRGAVMAALLGAIVLGGSALRFYGLDAQSLWNDELSSWRQSHQETISAVIEHGVRPTPHPPAYPVPQGESVLGHRAPPTHPVTPPLAALGDAPHEFREIELR